MELENQATKVVLPDLSDIQGVIADYLDVFVPTDKSLDERKKIIHNCVIPFSLLIVAWELVSAGEGGLEEQILTAFMQDVVSVHQRGNLGPRMLH